VVILRHGLPLTNRFVIIIISNNLLFFFTSCCAKYINFPSLFSYPKVLCFDAYFQETVPQRREEKYRVRKCKIYFYLEDDTIQVVEPELKNSGIPQGKLSKSNT